MVAKNILAIETESKPTTISRVIVFDVPIVALLLGYVWQKINVHT